MGRRRSWIWVNGVRHCYAVVVPKDPCYTTRFFFQDQPSDPDANDLVREATVALNQITEALEERVGNDQRTIRFLVFENPESGDDELSLTVVHTDLDIQPP